uniref:B30.2/SPRY domain-containing protein n=1 Tax=Labrus bergylta TaxID=56723 RepID=A0A3Q3FBV8_9LABR
MRKPIKVMDLHKLLFTLSITSEGVLKVMSYFTEKIPVYVPNITEPTSRAELVKYWMNLFFDNKTANKMLWIGESASKVCRRTEEVCSVLDRPERYEYSPQVVFKQVIWKTRAYWEVEYSAGRRANSGPSGLGENEESWGLCWSGTRYQIWFNCNFKDITNVPYCSTIGVYVDQPAGIINFYIVTGEEGEREVRLLHRAKTTTDEKILPGFWVGIQSSCTILKKPE